MSDSAGPLPMNLDLGCQRLVRSGLLLCFKRETKEKKKHFRPFVNNYVTPFFDKMHNQLELGANKV
jgi:hypothetical protein